MDYLIGLIGALIFGVCAAVFLAFVSKVAMRPKSFEEVIEEQKRSQANLLEKQQTLRSASAAAAKKEKRKKFRRGVKAGDGDASVETEKHSVEDGGRESGVIETETSDEGSGSAQGTPSGKKKDAPKLVAERKVLKDSTKESVVSSWSDPISDPKSLTKKPEVALGRPSQSTVDASPVAEGNRKKRVQAVSNEEKSEAVVDTVKLQSQSQDGVQAKKVTTEKIAVSRNDDKSKTTTPYVEEKLTKPVQKRREKEAVGMHQANVEERLEKVVPLASGAARTEQTSKHLDTLAEGKSSRICKKKKAGEQNGNGMII